jgi:hypothetical protein
MKHTVCICPTVLSPLGTKDNCGQSIPHSLGVYPTLVVGGDTVVFEYWWFPPEKRVSNKPGTNLYYRGSIFVCAFCPS